MSSIQTSILDFGQFWVGKDSAEQPEDQLLQGKFQLPVQLSFRQGDLMLLEFLIERTTWNTQPSRGLLYSSALFFQHSLDMLLLEFKKSQP